jgi:hypothetical protein
MSCPEIYHVRVSTACLFYLAVCDRLKQSLISVGRLTSETKEKLKTGYIRRSQDVTEVYMILHK